jgi:hypothetical protein
MPVIGPWITSKRCVSYEFPPYQGPNSLHCQLIDIIETVYRGASKGRGLVVSPKGTILLVCPAPFVKLIALKRLLDTLQVLRMSIVIPSSFLLCH